MIFTFIYLFLVLVPGALLTVLLGIRHQQLLFSITFSFGFLISLVSLARNYIWGVGIFTASYIALIAVLVCLLMLRKKELGRHWTALCEAVMDIYWVIGLALVAAMYLAWYLLAGPYTEIPADLYRHMEFTKHYYGSIGNDSFGPPLTLSQLAAQLGGFWYVLVAFAANLSGALLIDVIYPTMLVNGLIFILAVYVFSNELFRVLDLSELQVRIAAVITCVFVSLQMGVTTYSFIRYYSMAPGILNMVVMFAALVCFMHLLGQRRDRADLEPNLNAALSVILLVLCFGIALAMHNQEALFILVMGVIAVSYMVYIWIADNAGGGLKGSLVAIGIFISIVVSLLFFLPVFFNQPPAPDSPHQKVVPLPFELPNYGPLYVLNPKYQFSEVVTLWGGIVYIAFVLWFQFFRRQPLLVAGMLVPLFTIFNPLFVDLFIRIKDDHSLWRLCYLIPLYPVAGLFIVRFTDTMGTDRSEGFFQKGLILAIVLALVILPFSTGLNRYVRLSNRPVAEANSYHLWQDLLDELNSYTKSERILTDPVTGYVISALTPHHTFRYKFFASELYHAFPFVFEHYDDLPLGRYRGWLLVINKREGNNSRTGSISRHWPEDIMKVSKYYPENLLSHLKDNPELYELVWGQNRISVYRIR